MFFISKQVDYAVQFLMALAKLGEGQFLSVKEFSKKRTISFLFLQKIARNLKRSGFIESAKGSKGGYALLVHSKDINLMKVVEAVEGSYGLTSCIKDKNHCPVLDACLSKNSLQKVHDDMVHILEKYTIFSMI